MKHKVKLLLTANLFMLLPHPAAAAVRKSTTAASAEIFADRMSYDRNKNLITARGSVEVFYKDMRFTADLVEFDNVKSEIYGWGGVNFTKSGYSLKSSEIFYNINTSTGTVYNTSVKAPPMYVYAEEVQIRGNDEFFIPSGDITTCDHNPPHYMFRGKKIHLKLNSRFSALNTLMYVRGVPTFFYPYYTKNLGPEGLKLDFDAGKSSRDGYFLKSSVIYPFTRNSESYLGLDFMTERGVGFKGGHTYRTNKGFANVDGYYINEKNTGIKRGKLYLRGWQEIFKDISVRYRTEYTSDYDFNYNYSQAYYDFRQNNLYYQLGFEYSPSKYILSLYGNKMESWTEKGYEVSDLVVPGAELKLLPVKISKRYSFWGETGYENRYFPSEEKWASSFGWEGKIQGIHRLNFSGVYFLTLTPGFSYDGVWKEGFIIDDYVGLSAGLRQGFYGKLFVDNSYRWRRSAKYPFTIVENLLKTGIRYRPLRNIDLSMQTYFDFSENPVNSVREDIYSTVRYRFFHNRIYLRNRYDYKAEKTREWLVELEISDYAQTRVKYSYLYPDRLDIQQKFMFHLRPFYLTLGARFYLDNFNFDRFVEHSASLDWDMHCWNSRMQVLKRGDETQVWLLFNLTAFPRDKVGVYGNLKHRDLRYHRE